MPGLISTGVTGNILRGARKLIPITGALIRTSIIDVRITEGPRKTTEEGKRLRMIFYFHDY